MQRESIKEEVIVKYLLGDLADAEQIELEDRAFADRQYLENILAVEDDLIDSYLRGSLSGRQRRQFETRFLASNERRQKVEFARALAEVSARRAVAEEPATAWQSFVAMLRNLSPVFQVSLAAASLAAIIGVAWLVGQSITRRQEVKELSQKQPPTEPTARQERQPEPVPPQPAGSQPVPPQPAAPKLAPPTMATITLFPGISRSASDRARLVIPETARLTRLQVGLERTDEYKSFRVEIRDSQDREVLTRDRLQPQQSRAGRVITLVIPGSAFRTGQYELALKGSVDDQKTEDLRYYYFDVQKK